MTTEEKNKLLYKIEAMVLKLDEAISNELETSKATEGRQLQRQSNRVLGVLQAIDSLKHEI